MKVIELAGLPGAGKTTTLRSLEELYDGPCRIQSFFSLENAYPDWRRLRQLRHLSRFLTRHPKSAVETTRLWAHATRGDLHAFKRVLRCWVLADRIDNAKRNGGGDILILDQGFLQSIGSLTIPAGVPEPANIAPALRSMATKRIDGVVWLECPKRVAEARRLQRNYGTCCFNNAAGNGSNENLERFEIAILSGRAEASSLGIPILELSGESSAPTNARRIADWIETLGSARSSGEDGATGRRG